MKKVLAVDDNVEILEVIRLIFEISGYETECVSNWQNVDDAVSQFQPDLILMDIMLGGADGRDICNSLKSDKRTGHIPIIMISASHDLYKSAEKNCKADDFISKPFDIDQLIALVDSYVN